MQNNAPVTLPASANTETNTLSRRGRPRRTDAIRDRNNHIVAAEYRDDPARMPKWNKIRENATIVALDPRLATQRGKLFYMRQFSEHEFEAANRWADLLEGYDTLILGRRRTPASPALERLGHGEGHERAQEAIDRFRERFRAAHDVLISAGKVSEAAVTKLCRDEAAGAMMVEARKGLQALMVHFGLVKGKR